MKSNPTNLRGLSQQPALVLWALYVFLIPFYIFPSGLPQPSDLLVLLVLPFSLLGWSGRLLKGAPQVIRALLWFTLWTVAVNYSWALFTGRWTGLKDYLIFPLFYAFNVCVFASGLILYQRYRDRLLRLTAYALFASVLVQVMASFVIGGHQLRGTMFFNNPNQLGYYALLAATLIAIAHRRIRLGAVVVAVGLTGCAYLALISASRAALGGIAVLVVLLVFQNLRVILLAAAAAVALVSLGGPVSNAIDASAQRALQGKDNGKTFAEERGYDRLWRFKEYMVIGAGEGDNVRFDPPNKEHELHSSFATVLFSYGIVGCVLFLMFVTRLMKRASFRSAAMLVPVAIYMTAHQGLRFTLLWVLLAVFVALKEQ